MAATPLARAGDYVRAFVGKNQDAGRIPMITYYEILQASGVSEGAAEVTVAANDAKLMARYFADFRFLLQQIDKATAFVHVEPDLWGYAQQANNNPHAQPAAVASANATDCAGEENSIAGLGRCLVKMTPGLRADAADRPSTARAGNGDAKGSCGCRFAGISDIGEGAALAGLALAAAFVRRRRR